MSSHNDFTSRVSNALLNRAYGNLFCVEATRTILPTVSTGSLSTINNVDFAHLLVTGVFLPNALKLIVNPSNSCYLGAAVTSLATASEALANTLTHTKAACT